MQDPSRLDRILDFGKLKISELHRLERKSPRDVDLLIHLGRIYLKQRELSRARYYYQRALEIDPEDGWTHLYLGNWHYAISCYEKAEFHFRRAIALLPDIACPYWCLADVLKSQGYLSRTESFYRKAVQVDPDDSTAIRKLDRWREEFGSALDQVTSHVDRKNKNSRFTLDLRNRNPKNT